MLTVAIVFLIAAIVTAVFGLFAAVPAGLVAAAVFFVVFLWASVLDENPLKGTTRRP